MGRHAVLELDAPTEQLVVAPRVEDDSKPLLPTWFLPGLFGSMAFVVIILLIALAIGNGHRVSSAIPAAAPAPTASSVEAAQTQRYLTDITGSAGDMSANGPQYGRSRVAAHSDAWVSAGREACQLRGRGLDYDQAQAQLASEWSNASFGQPANTKRIYFSNIVFFGWRDLC